jgi:hypothetical protein
MNITVRLLEGVFLESNKHSKTNVYSTGRGTQHDPVRVKSETVTIQEFWLQTGGDERKITLYDEEVKARQGHHISMIIADDESDNACFVGYVNYTTDLCVRFDNSRTAQLFAKNAAPCILTLALAFIAGGVAWYVEGFITGLMALAGGLVVSAIVRNIHAAIIKNDITRECEAITARAIQNYVQSHPAITEMENSSTPAS